MDKFSKQVLETIRRENLIPAGSSLILGFSGGADSVCLLSTLTELQKLLKLRITAVHVNHNLRGEEAVRDQNFCEQFCQERGIGFEAVSVNVRALVKEKGLSTEEAARQLRYRVLTEKAGETGLIAVAHHADDQAETILLNLIRGTGLKGMRGMEYRRGNIVRPLLDRTRREILETLCERNLPFVTDSTNLSEDYARNRIRRKVLPELESVNEKAAAHLLEAGKKAGEAQEFLEVCGRKKADEVCRVTEAMEQTQQPEIRVSRKILREEPQILRRYVIIELLRRTQIPLKDWGETHIEAIDGLLFKARGCSLNLPEGVTAENTEKEMIIRKARA